MDKIKIGGVMQSDGRALIRLMSVPADPSAGASLCQALASSGTNIELMVETFDIDDALNFAVVVAQKDLDKTLSVAGEIKAGTGAKGLSYVPDVAIISIFGPHLREKPKIPGLMFGSIASVGVNPLAIATSISSVSCVVEGQHLDTAVEALLEVFDVPFKVAKRPQNW